VRTAVPNERFSPRLYRQRRMKCASFRTFFWSTRWTTIRPAEHGDFLQYSAGGRALKHYFDALDGELDMNVVTSRSSA